MFFCLFLRVRITWYFCGAYTTYKHIITKATLDKHEAGKMVLVLSLYLLQNTHTHTQKYREQKGYFPRFTGIHGVLSNLVLFPALKFSQPTVEEKYPG